MAKASKTTIEKSVTKKERVPAVILTLEVDEARALRTLLGRVKGSGKTRSALARIDDELYYSDVLKVDGLLSGEIIDGTVTFSPYNNPLHTSLRADLYKSTINSTFL